MPFHCDDPRTDKWAMQTLDEIHPIAKRSRNLLHEGDEAGTNSDQYPVEIVPTVVLKREGDQENVNSSDGTSYSSLPEWSKDPRLQFQTLTMEMLWWQNQVLKLRLPGRTAQELIEEYGYRYAWLFNPPIVDCPNMLLVRSTSASKQKKNLSKQNYPDLLREDSKLIPSIITTDNDGKIAKGMSEALIPM